MESRMSLSSGRRILSRIRSLVRPNQEGPVADSVLLARFAEQNDESAFAQLMELHGGLVWGVCQRVLGHCADAEDAFQATFVVLARKAAAISKRNSVRSWLHGVAYRVSRKALQTQAIRRIREAAVTVAEPATTNDEPTWKEVRQVLDEELLRLPEKYRLPLLLCYLEGKTQDEAARQLGWSAGVVRGRLDRGRERLRKRLVRRGIGLGAVLAATLAAQCVAQAAVPMRLQEATLQATMLQATEKAALVSASVAALSEEVFRSTLTAKIRLAGVLLFSCLIIAVGTLLVAMPRGDQMEAVAPPAPPAPETPPAPRQAEPRLDSHGDPLPASAVARFGTMRLRGSKILPLGFSADSRTLISTSNDALVQFWEADTGKLLRSIQAKEDSSRCVALSPDGKFLACGSNDGSVELIETRDGKSVSRMENPGTKCSFYTLVFSPDNRLLLTKQSDQKIALWDMETRKHLRTLAEQGVWSGGDNVGFTPDSKTIVGGSGVGFIYLWDAASGKKLREMGQLDSHVSTAIVSPDGKLAAAADWKGKVQVWDFASGKRRHSFTGAPDGVFTLAFSPDSQTLASAGADHSIRVWNMASGELTREITGNNNYTYRIRFSPDGKTLAAGGQENAIRLWSVASGKEVLPRRGHQAWLFATAISPDGKIMASAGREDAIRLWDMAARKEIRQLRECEGWIERLAFSPNGKLLASASRDRIVRIWETETGRVVHRFRGVQQCSNPVAFSPDGKRLVASGAGNSVRIWDVDSGEETHTLDGHPDEPICLAFAPDGDTFAAGGNDGKNKGYVRIWSLSRRASLRDLDHPQLCRSISFSPSGRIIAVGEDSALHLWEVATGKELARMPKGLGGVSAATFSPDGKLLASGGYDNSTVIIWDAIAAKPRQILCGHRDGVPSVAFLPDGRSLASASYDTSVLLWNVDFPERNTARADWKEEDLQRLWGELSGEDATRVYAAMRDLASTPRQSARFIAGKAPSAKREADAKRVNELISQLDDDDFATRTGAAKELEGLGDLVEARVRKDLALPANSLEKRRHLERLLQVITQVTPEQALWLRAMETLEWIGTDDATSTVKMLQARAPSYRIEREAGRALDRLKK